MSNFSQSELESLWVQGGGPSNVASLMAAIAMAESDGNPYARNPTSGACGLWQIYPAQLGCDDPLTNAQLAAGKYQRQGLGAWDAYTNGSYKSFYTGSSASLMSTNAGGCATFNTLGVCFDGVVGLGAVALGLSLIAGVFIMLIFNDPRVKQAAKTAITVAATIPK